MFSQHLFVAACLFGAALVQGHHIRLKYSYTLECHDRPPTCSLPSYTPPELLVRLQDGREVYCSTETHDAGYEVIEETYPEEYFDVLGSGLKEWRLAFRGTPYINISVLGAFENGAGIPDNLEIGCKSIDSRKLCRNHYRNDDALDNWTNVKKVLFAIYKDDRVVQSLQFDATGTTYMNWFSKGKLENTTYTDLKSTSTNFFSILGDALFDRRFFVNHRYNDCPGDEGWFLAVDRLNPPCDYESVAIETFPIFKYSTLSTLSRYDSTRPGNADAIGIFVKY